MNLVLMKGLTRSHWSKAQMFKWQKASLTEKVVLVDRTEGCHL